MAIESEVIRDVYVNCGMPPQRVLPLTTVLPRIHKALRFYGLQAEQSDQNFTLKVSAAFSPTGKDVAVPVGWNMAPNAVALVEVLADEANGVWDPIDIVNKVDLHLYEESGQPAVAFYGTPQRMCFSWDVAAVPFQVRVSYDQAPADPATLETKIFLPDNLVPMVGVDVAIESIPDVMQGMPERENSLMLKLELLLAQQREWREEWKIKRFTSPQQGSTTRQAFNRSRPGWRAGRWRR